MLIYSRYFLKIFIRKSVGVFILVQLFVALCVLLDLLPRYPNVIFAYGLSILPDLIIVYLPRSLPFAIVLGAILSMEYIRKQNGFLWIQIAGHDPRRYQFGVLIIGLLISIALWWLNADIIPKVKYSTLQSLSSLKESPRSLALLLAEKPNLFKGFLVNFDSITKNELTDFSLISTKKNDPMVMTARSANLELINEGSFLELKANKGRFLKLGDDGKMESNLRFDKFSIRFDANRLFEHSKTKIISLKYYTNEELTRLPELAQYRQQRGIMLSEQQKGRLNGIFQVRAIRLQFAITPFLFCIIVVVFLGVYITENPFLRTVMVVTFCLMFILPQQIILEQMARRAKLPDTWYAFLPTLEIMLVLLFSTFPSLFRWKFKQ